MPDEVLYSASTRSGTYYEEPEEVEEEEEEVDPDPMFTYRMALYMKVGLFCRWSWPDYDQTPIEVIEWISEEMDRRFENFEQVYLNWEVLYLLQAVSRVFKSE